MKVDFTGVSDSFEPVPSGSYRAGLTSFKIQDSKAGKTYVSLELTLRDQEYGGRKVWQNHSFAPQALWALKKTCKALGAEDDDLTEVVDVEELLGGLIGSDCMVSLDVRDYEGRLSNSIVDIRSYYE